MELEGSTTKSDFYYLLEEEPNEEDPVGNPTKKEYKELEEDLFEE
jgi:hypothetical protein